jgi:predicted RNase H-like nuclease (RuvC/YqgF family)
MRRERVKVKKPTIAQLMIENETLRKRIADLDGINLGQQRENSNLKTEIYNGLDRERKLRELAKDERKEVLWFRTHLDEVRRNVTNLRQRIAFIIDCVGGRQTADCEPMGKRLHVNVSYLLSAGLDIPASEIQSSVNLQNIMAHKQIRDTRENGLPAIDPLTEDF